MRTKLSLLVVALCVLATAFPGAASARRTRECTEDQFFKQTYDYTPEEFEAAFVFDMRCLPDGTELVFDVSLEADRLLDGTATTARDRCDTRQKKCRVEVSLEHDLVERATYTLSMSVSMHLGDIEATGSGSESFECTSLAVEAFCE